MAFSKDAISSEFDFSSDELKEQVLKDMALEEKRKAAKFIKKFNEYDREFTKRKTINSFLSSDNKFIYHLGIIDYLQTYDLKKKFETKAKGLYKDENLISCVPP